MFVKKKKRNKIKLTFALLTWRLCLPFYPAVSLQDFLKIQFTKSSIFSIC